MISNDNPISQGAHHPMLIGNNYRSTNGNRSIVARLSPSSVFYPKLLLTFWRAAKLAKQGIYDNTTCIRDTAYIFRCLEDVGLRFEIENVLSFKNLKTPCVFVSNHMSTLETLGPCNLGYQWYQRYHSIPGRYGFIWKTG